MARFSFTARNMKGGVESGTLEAVSTQAARAELVERGLLVEELHEATGNEPTLDAITAQPLSWVVDEHDEPHANIPQKTTVSEQQLYFPFMDTLRLYAGWLLAWYAGIYLFGYYQESRSLPYSISYIENLYKSPLVLSFALGAFLFLLCTTVHRAFGHSKSTAFIIAVLGVAAFIVYRTIVQ